jgi:hypothetical protein
MKLITQRSVVQIHPPQPSKRSIMHVLMSSFVGLELPDRYYLSARAGQVRAGSTGQAVQRSVSSFFGTVAHVKLTLVDPDYGPDEPPSVVNE